ncbi:unnamed protein product [Effrenium voratum]|uniref:Uncharacterized protein n=1 Tax=Effrenium voratum TaxID=2562239 RepID=A0AA36N138_9DINO|nr:unnamed protein product [Effrenium voratum]
MGGDKFKLVLLGEMQSGETIHVTFAVVDGSGNLVGDRSKDLSYQASSCQLAGTILDAEQGVTSGKAIPWDTTEQISNGGDTLIAVSDAGSFLCAIHTESDTWGYDSSTQQSALPTGLTAASSDAIASSGKRSMCYTGTSSGTGADLKAAIGDLNNWELNTNFVSCTSSVARQKRPSPGG